VGGVGLAKRGRAGRELMMRGKQRLGFAKLFATAGRKENGGRLASPRRRKQDKTQREKPTGET